MTLLEMASMSTDLVLGLVALSSFLLGFFACRMTWRQQLSDWRAREKSLMDNAADEREMYQTRLDQAHAAAAAERHELYSRIQAYDPNVGDFRPPDYTAPPSRPGEEVQAERSYTEVELGQMGLVEQADGMIRDTKNDALYESVEDWRCWLADLKKRSLPTNVRPDVVQELGWEQAVAIAKKQTADKKAVAKN
jgi:hypothetical protein